MIGAKVTGAETQSHAGIKPAHASACAIQTCTLWRATTAAKGERPSGRP